MSGKPKRQKRTLDPERAALRGRIGGHQRAANHGHSELSQVARQCWEDSWMRRADPDGVLSVAERARRAEALQKAHMAKMTLARWANRPAKPVKKAS